MTSQLNAVEKVQVSRRSVIEGQEKVLVVVLAALWVAMALTTPTFIEPNSVFSILYGVSPIVLIGVAMTAVMTTGGIDVSVGSMFTFVMVVIGRVIRDAGVSAPMAIAVAVLVGATLGAVNAVLVSIGRIPAMIVTFGTLNIFRFAALQVFGDTQLSGVPDTLRFIGGSVDAAIMGVPNSFLLALVVALLGWLYMRYWATGRHIYAIGNDASAARLAGVKVRRRTFELYVASGVAVGLAAAVSTGSGGLIQQNVGVGLEMSVIAACVIGGTSVVGGRGTVLGTVLGALLVGSVQAAITHLHLPNQLTQLFVGLVIIVAVGVDLARQARRNRR